jgi:hypothetical protein
MTGLVAVVPGDRWLVGAKAGFPDPRAWGWSPAGWGQDLVESALADLMVQWTRWSLSSAIGMADYVWRAASRGAVIDLETQADTYALTQALAAGFLVGVLWWSIGAAALKGDVGAVGRRLFIDAPKVVVGSTAMLAVLAAAAAATGELEGWVVGSIGSPAGPFAALEVAALDDTSEVSLVAMLPVLVISAAIVVVSVGLALFLVIRFAAVNLLVVFVPLALLGQVTPYSSMARLLLEKLLALLLSKTVILISLSVAGTLIGDPGSGTDQVFFSEPAPAAPGEEVAAVDIEAAERARLADSVDGFGLLGSMLAGLGVLVVAGFSPVMLFQLIPSAYHDTAPYSGSDVGPVFGGGDYGFGPARRTAARATWPFTGRRP